MTKKLKIKNFELEGMSEIDIDGDATFEGTGFIDIEGNVELSGNIKISVKGRMTIKGEKDFIVADCEYYEEEEEE